MIRFIAGQLQTEIALYGRADVGGTSSVNTPAAILVLVLKNVARRFAETFLLSATQKRVQQDIVRLEGGVSLELAAPVALFMLLRKQLLAGSIDGGGHSARQVINFSKRYRRNDRSRRGGGGGIFHILGLSTPAPPP